MCSPCSVSRVVASASVQHHSAPTRLAHKCFPAWMLDADGTTSDLAVKANKSEGARSQLGEPEEEVLAQMHNFTAAGQETTAGTLS